MPVLLSGVGGAHASRVCWRGLFAGWLLFQLMWVELVPLGAADLGRGKMMGLVGLGDGVGFVGYSVQWVAAVVEWPSHRTLNCCLLHCVL